MKLCVYGAGAVGGEVAARIGAAGLAEVSVVARGAHLAAIREHGITLETAERNFHTRPVAATDDSTALPPQDVITVGLKAHDLPAHAERIAALLKPDGCAVFMTNGLPWWWNHGRDTHEGVLPLLDPDGRLWRLLAPRSMGCVVYAAAEVARPGWVRHGNINRWILGEPDNSRSARLTTVADLFSAAGLKSEITEDIRRAIWAKLVRNASINPAGALTRLTVNEIRGDEDLRAILVAIIRETMAVARALGWELEGEVDIAASTSPAAGTDGVRSSMLQDVLAGRVLEVDALLGQIQVFARTHGVPVPTIDIVAALLRGLGRAVRRDTTQQGAAS